MDEFHPEFPKDSEVFALCPKCKKFVAVDIDCKHGGEWNSAVGDFGGETWFFILTCRGCLTTFFKKRWASTDDMVEVDDGFGNLYEDYNWHVEYWPSKKREAFQRIDDFPLSIISPSINGLLRQTYEATALDLRTLAAMGARATFECAATHIGVDSSLPFVRKLRELQNRTLIGIRDAEALSALVEAGNAASHRGWTPTENELVTIIEILNHFVEVNVLRPARIQELQSNIPNKKAHKKK